jgi:hypothetical protein
MAADLFESYAVTLVAALILGRAAFGDYGLVFPLIVPAIGALTAVLGVFVVRPRPGESGLTAINRGFYISAVVSAVACGIAAFLYLPATFGELTNASEAVLSLNGDPRVLATAPSHSASCSRPSSCGSPATSPAPTRPRRRTSPAPRSPARPPSCSPAWASASSRPSTPL